MVEKITFLRQPEVSRRTGHNDVAMYRLIQAGTFPQQIRISKRSVGWREDQIDEWCRAKAEGRKLDYHPAPEKAVKPQRIRDKVNRRESQA